MNDKTMNKDYYQLLLFLWMKMCCRLVFKNIQYVICNNFESSEYRFRLENESQTQRYEMYNHDI